MLYGEVEKNDGQADGLNAIYFRCQKYLLQSKSVAICVSLMAPELQGKVLGVCEQAMHGNYKKKTFSNLDS